MVTLAGDLPTCSATAGSRPLKQKMRSLLEMGTAPRSRAQSSSWKSKAATSDGNRPPVDGYHIGATGRISLRPEMQVRCTVPAASLCHLPAPTSTDRPHEGTPGFPAQPRLLLRSEPAEWAPWQPAL